MAKFPVSSRFCRFELGQLGQLSPILRPVWKGKPKRRESGLAESGKSNTPGNHSSVQTSLRSTFYVLRSQSNSLIASTRLSQKLRMDKTHYNDIFLKRKHFFECRKKIHSPEDERPESRREAIGATQRGPRICVVDSEPSSSSSRRDFND